MRRIFGSVAIFCGWLSIPISAVAGLITSEFLGLSHVEGAPPPTAVYGVSEVVLLWLLIATATITILPALMAMFARDPSQPLYLAAFVMGLIGLLMLPEPLGRTYTLIWLPGAALLAWGGWLIHTDIPPAAEGAASAGTAAKGAGSAAGLAVTAAAGQVEPSTPVQPGPNGKRGRKKGPATAARTSRTRKAGECPWCSAKVPAGAESCPGCRATLEPRAVVGEMPLSGITAVAPELLAYENRVANAPKKQGWLKLLLSDDDRLQAASPEPADLTALEPPTAEVRAAMDSIAREAAAQAAAAEAAAEAAERLTEIDEESGGSGTTA
jgi:hypothetical protein